MVNLRRLVPEKFRAPDVHFPPKPGSMAQLQRLVDISGTPQTSFHVEVDGNIQMATVIQGQHEWSPAVDTGPLHEIPGRGEHSTTPPNIVRMTAVNEDGATTLYSVASLTKIFVNVAFYRLLSSCRYAALGVSWEKSACDLFNELRRNNGKSTIRRFSRDPSIRELLLHRNGFAPMNRELFAPDGTFIMSEQDFLEVAPQATEDYFKGQKQGFTEYSNANHIFAGMLLEEITELSLSEAMKKLVFGPLDMSHTVMDMVSWVKLQSEGVHVALGHRVSAQMNVSNLPMDHNYLKDNIEAASLGAYSSTEDIAKLVREFLKALDHKSGVFSEDDALHFFGPMCDDQDGGKISLAGLFCPIDSNLPGSESLHTKLDPALDTLNNRLGKLPNGSRCKIYYKAGAVDGYTCTLYISLKHRMFVIALANCSGPVDVTDHIARYFLQETFDLDPRIDVIQDAVSKCARCCQRLYSLEESDQDMLNWQDNIEKFVGTYQHVKYGQEIEVTVLGDAVLHGKGKSSSKMKARASGDMLRIFPGEQGFGIDRWSVWNIRDYRYQERGEDVYLISQREGAVWRRTRQS